jgi:CRISPR/Cas system-associated endonuclease Cas3-HD
MLELDIFFFDEYVSGYFELTHLKLKLKENILNHTLSFHGYMLHHQCISNSELRKYQIAELKMFSC